MGYLDRLSAIILWRMNKGTKKEDKRGRFLCPVAFGDARTKLKGIPPIHKLYPGLAAATATGVAMYAHENHPRGRTRCP